MTDDLIFLFHFPVILFIPFFSWYNQVTMSLKTSYIATKNIELPQQQIIDFCRRWEITELALFGSVLRDDFDPKSDVDVLVTFEPAANMITLT